MKVIFVDIDETICFYEGKRDYSKAIPNLENIEKINILYNRGHYIKYWTARGSVTGKDWLETTADQLDEWGCLYHELITGEKPDYDLIICDKSKRIEEI